jgi:aconitate hydratase
MVKLHDGGVYLVNGETLVPEAEAAKVEQMTGKAVAKEEAKKGTIAYGIMKAHNQSDTMDKLQIKFDAMVSHDITFVGIIQTARASGMEKFPLPYVLTCCHNSLCAVGGTINDDDHYFGLSAAKKYGGLFVPPHVAVCHQYMRECFAGGGKMILGSDSHTRYGALGTMAIGEGGGELSKQLLKQTYDVAYPGVIAIYLTGKPQPFVGPHDIALAICGAVYKNGYVKNKVMEFVGPGVSSMTTDYRNGVDVMTTETTCLSSIWRTDDDTKAFLEKHHRGDEFKELNPEAVAYYDGCVEIDLSTIKPMIALPFHPSNAFEIDYLYENLEDILRETEKAADQIAEGRAHFTLLDKITKDGKLQVQQGIIAGCAGGNYTNVVEAAHALKGKNIGDGEFYLSVYPSSQPVYTDLDRKGLLADLMDAGAIIRSAFRGPCFGAGDTPANNALSIRHTTRNFPNREGSKPGNGQMSAVALMDARSIAATAANGGKLTSAETMDCWGDIPEYNYEDRAYKARVYNGYNKAEEDSELRFGPNIKDWPEMEALSENILLKVSSKILDEVTTTDELIPSGETSSFRSNPLGLAEFTLSRRDPEYVGRAKAVQAMENERLAGKVNAEIAEVIKVVNTIPGQEAVKAEDVEIGSTIYANKPGYAPAARS